MKNASSTFVFLVSSDWPRNAPPSQWKTRVGEEASTKQSDLISVSHIRWDQKLFVEGPHNG